GEAWQREYSASEARVNGVSGWNHSDERPRPSDRVGAIERRRRLRSFRRCAAPPTRGPSLDAPRARPSCCGMRIKRRLSLAALAAVAALPSIAQATISEALSLRDLTQRADRVVIATVVGEQARRDS